MACSVLVTGSNRGIGLAIVKYLLNHPDPPKTLIAACKNPDEAKELQELKLKNPNLHLLHLDLAKLFSLPDVCSKVESIVGETGLNVLLNNVGVNLETYMKPETLGYSKPKEDPSVYVTDVIGPILLTKSLLPLIERAAGYKEQPRNGKYPGIYYRGTLLPENKGILGIYSGIKFLEIADAVEISTQACGWPFSLR